MFQRLRDGETRDERFDRDPETERRVTWTEQVEEKYTLITERLVWAGGAEKEITYCLQTSHPHGHPYYQDINGETVIECNERPAYTEPLDEETVTREKTVRKSAWISGSFPPGVEEGDNTRKVYVEEQ